MLSKARPHAVVTDFLLIIQMSVSPAAQLWEVVRVSIVLRPRQHRRLADQSSHGACCAPPGRASVGPRSRGPWAAAGLRAEPQKYPAAPPGQCGPLATPVLCRPVRSHPRPPSPSLVPSLPQPSWAHKTGHPPSPEQPGSTVQTSCMGSFRGPPARDSAGNTQATPSPRRPTVAWE